MIPEAIEGVPVKKIGDGAFMNGWLSSVVLPSSLEEIGESAFEMNQLYEVEIPKGVTKIGVCAFSTCPLNRVDIPAAVTEIGARAFACPIFVDESNEYYSSDTTGVLFDKNKTVLLKGCSSGDTAVIPASVREIADSACAYNSGITTIVFQGNAPEFGYDPLEKVKATVYYPQRNSTWNENVMPNYGGMLTWKTGEIEHAVAEGVYTFEPTSGAIKKFVPANGTEPFSLVIPDSISGVPVTKIMYSGMESVKGAFEGCQNLVDVQLPDTVTDIGMYAFKNCRNLQSITLSRQLKNIAYQAFEGTGIKQLVLTASVQTVEDGAFCRSALEQVEIWGDEVLLMGGSFCECYALRTIRFQGDQALFGGGDGRYVFGPMVEIDEDMQVTIYYPSENPTWETLPENEKLGANVTWVAEEAVQSDFDGNGVLTDADAVYLLRHTLFPEQYPIPVEVDFNGDGMTTDADAVYLLRHTLFPEEFPLNA